MKHHELVRWRLITRSDHYTMLTMRRFTTMSYCLPNWRLIYTLLLLVSILFAGCRSDVGIETQPVSKLSPDQLVTQTFHYTGSDQTIQTRGRILSNECLMREPWTNNVMVRAHEGKKGRCTGKLNSYGKADGLKERVVY